MQLIGRCGRGKSTHLRCLQEHLPNAHYARVWNRQFTGTWPPPVPVLPPGTQVLLLDEADQLPIWSRVSLFRQVQSVVVATHRDLALSLRLGGKRSELVSIAQSPDVAWLRRALNRRIEYFRRTAGPVPQLTDVELQALVDRFGDDLRGMERSLYNDFQRRNQHDG